MSVTTVPRPGRNHKDGCDGKRWRYSGHGYNRVKLCACGAEDHAPGFASCYYCCDDEATLCLHSRVPCPSCAKRRARPTTGER